MSKGLLTSFSELKLDEPSKEDPKPASLDLDLGEIDVPLRNEEEQKILQANSKAVREFVEKHLRKIDEFVASSREALADPKVKQKVREQIQKIWTKINDLLHRNPEPAYRQATFVSLLVHIFKAKSPEDFTAANRILDHMVKNRYLIEVNPDSEEKASLYAWKRGFRVPEHACFGRPEFEEVKNELSAFVNRTMSKTVNQRNDRANKLQEEATLEVGRTFEEGSSGVSFLYVPPEISFKNGKVKTYGGGFILADLQKSGQIYPIEGVGSFEEDLQEVYSENTSVERFTLDWDFPYSRKYLEGKFGWPEEKINGYYLFWNLLKRAKEHLQRSDVHQEEKLTLSKKGVSLSEEVFFLDHQDGIVFVDFEGIWENWTQEDNGKKKKETVKDLFFLVERLGGKIKIVSCPEHLRTFFTNCMGSYNEGEKFQGTPQPLQSVLQAQYGACQTKALIS